MEFYDENNIKINNKSLERFEQNLVYKYITPNCVVLELGARYGTVSCAINSKLGFTCNQVSVEPDNRVWEALENNKKRNNCNFHIYKGFISRKPLKLTNLNAYHGGYGATFEDLSDNQTTDIESTTLEEIQNKYNLKFNTLVADCEGFLERFFDENPWFYDQLELIIFEVDYKEKCDYKKIFNELKNRSFKSVEYVNLNQFVLRKKY